MSITDMIFFVRLSFTGDHKKKYHVYNRHYMCRKNITAVKDRCIKSIMSVIDIISAKDITPIKAYKKYHACKPGSTISAVSLKS